MKFYKAIIVVTMIVLGSVFYFFMSTESELKNNEQLFGDEASSTPKSVESPPSSITYPTDTGLDVVYEIQATAPTGDSILEIGKVYNVDWTGYPGTEPLTIALQTTTPEGVISAEIVASDVPAAFTGSYRWLVPKLSTQNKYKVEIYPAGGRELVARNDGYFTLIDNMTAEEPSYVAEEYEIYTVHPGFVSPEFYAEFEKTKKTCVGRSEPIPSDPLIDDGPTLAKCFGYLE